MANINTVEVFEWQLTKTTVAERIKHLYSNSLMADVHFVVADKRGSDHPKVKIPCHKFVLAVSSPVFFAMFYGDLQELSESIDLPDCDSEGLLEFLRYIYCDEVQLNGSCVMQVLYLARKYMIPSLADHCRSFLEANINAESVLDVLPVIDKLEEAHLTSVCWNVVDAHTEEILQSASASLLEDRKELLVSMLRRDSLKIKEVKIFQAVNCWAKDICTKQRVKPSGKEKRKVIGETILRLIRFPLMSQKEFAEEVPDTKVLTESEINQMFMYYNLNRKPGEFSCTPRGTESENIHRCKVPKKEVAGFLVDISGDNPVVDSISFQVNNPVILRGVRLTSCMGGQTYLVKVKFCGKTILEGLFPSDSEAKDGYYGVDITFEQCLQLTSGVAYVLKGFIGVHNNQMYTYYHKRFGKEEVVCEKVTFKFLNVSHKSKKGYLRKGRITEILFTYPSNNK